MPLGVNDRASATALPTIEEMFGVLATVLQSKTVFTGAFDPVNTGIVPGQAYTILSENQAITLFGEGSQLHRMAKYWFLGNSDEITMIPFEANGTAATKTITFTTTGITQAGALAIRAGGFLASEIVNVAVDVADTDETIATKVSDAINEAGFLPYEASVATDTVTLTAKTADISGNQLTVVVNQTQEEQENAPQGLTVVVADGITGAGVGSITEALTLIQNNSFGWVTQFIQPYLSTSIQDEIQTVVGNPNTQSGLYDGLDYRPFNSFVVGKDSGEQGLIDLTDITKVRISDVANIYLGAPDSPEANFEIATLVAAKIAVNANGFENARAYTNVNLDELYGPLNPLENWTGTYSNRNKAVTEGLTPIIFGDEIKLGDVVTPWLPNDNQNAPFKTAVNQRKIWNTQLAYFTYLNSPNLQGRPIVNDLAAVDITANAIEEDVLRDGLALVTSNVITASAWIFDGDFTIRNTVVTIDSSNSSRFNVTLPIILSGNNRQQNGTVLVDTNIEAVNLTIFGG